MNRSGSFRGAWVKVVLEKGQFYDLLCPRQQENELIYVRPDIHPSTGTGIDLVADRSWLGLLGNLKRDELGPVWKFEAQLHPLCAAWTPA